METASTVNRFERKRDPEGLGSVPGKSSSLPGLKDRPFNPATEEDYERFPLRWWELPPGTVQDFSHPLGWEE